MDPRGRGWARVSGCWSAGCWVLACVLGFVAGRARSFVRFCFVPSSTPGFCRLTVSPPFPPRLTASSPLPPHRLSRLTAFPASPRLATLCLVSNLVFFFRFCHCIHSAPAPSASPSPPRSATHDVRLTTPTPNSSTSSAPLRCSRPLPLVSSSPSSLISCCPP